MAQKLISQNSPKQNRIKIYRGHWTDHKKNNNGQRNFLAKQNKDLKGLKKQK